MSPKSTAGLLLVLVALCLAYWLLVTLEKTERQRVIEAKRLFAFAPEDLQELEVKRIGEPETAAERPDAGDRTITKPNDTIEPNQVVWNRVALALAGLSNERTIDAAAKELAAYGLDEPVLTVSGVAADGARVQVAFGVMDPTQLHRYAQLLDGGVAGVFLVAKNAFFELDRPLIDLRNRYLVTVGEQGITRLEFAKIWQGADDDAEKAKAEAKGLTVGAESAVVIVERSDDGPWRTVEPVAGLADQDRVKALVEEIQFSVGRQYVDVPEDLSDYGLDPPRVRITVASGAGSPQTVLLGTIEQGEKEGGLFVKRASGPAVFTIASHLIMLLPETPDSFRESRLLTRRASDIQRIHYRTAETDVVLEDDPARGWAIVDPPREDTDQAAMSVFVAALKDVAGIAFHDELDALDDEAAGDARARFGLEQPIIAITLGFRGEEETSEILVGAQTDNMECYYAMQDTGVVVAVPWAAIDSVTWNEFDFRSRHLLRFVSATAIRVALRFEGTNYVFEMMHGKWLVRTPTNHSLESPSDMDTLLEAISSVNAIAIEAERVPEDLAPFGLDDPICVVHVTVRIGDAEPVAHGPLAIGATTEDDSRQRFAIMRGHPEVFRVKQAIIDGVREALAGVRQE